MTRDMSKKQFDAALARNGFRHVYLFWFADKTGECPGMTFGAVLRGNGKGIARRATIARLIQKRRKMAEQRRLELLPPSDG